MLSAWWQVLLDWIYPPRCPACRKFTNIHGEWCPACGPAGGPIQPVDMTSRHLRDLTAGYYLFAYEGVVRNLLRRLKFRSQRGAAVYLRWLLANRINWERFPRYDLIVPVPLHPARLAERGFNQTELLFWPWADERGLCWQELLSRCRATRPQWQLQLGQRRQNIKDAFSLTRPAMAEWVKDKQILLIDDIFTTGMTMNEL